MSTMSTVPSVREPSIFTTSTNWHSQASSAILQSVSMSTPTSPLVACLAESASTPPQHLSTDAVPTATMMATSTPNPPSNDEYASLSADQAEPVIETGSMLYQVERDTEQFEVFDISASGFGGR